MTKIPLYAKRMAGGVHALRIRIRREGGFLNLKGICAYLKKLYAYFFGILTKFRNWGTLMKPNFFDTFFWQENGKSISIKSKFFTRNVQKFHIF